MFFKIILLISTIVIPLKLVYANSSNYVCNGDANNLIINFDTINNIVIFGNTQKAKFWTEPNFIFWHSTKDNVLYEYTFKVSYNKLSGKLMIKSHNLVSSQNEWLNYDCLIEQ